MGSPVNSISISGMLTGQWKAKPRWPPMETSFGCQFQSPYVGLYVSFSLPRNFLPFLRGFCLKIHTKYFFKTEMSLGTSNIFRQNQTVRQVIRFTKIHYQTNEKPDKTVSINYFSKLPSARPHFTVSLPCLDNLTHFWSHMAFLNPFEYSIK